MAVAMTQQTLVPCLLCTTPHTALSECWLLLDQSEAALLLGAELAGGVGILSQSSTALVTALTLGEQEEWGPRGPGGTK